MQEIRAGSKAQALRGGRLFNPWKLLVTAALGPSVLSSHETVFRDMSLKQRLKPALGGRKM